MTGGELVEITADFGKILFVVGGAILGGFLLPGLGLVLPGIGGVSTFLGGALLGAAIGYRLANYFDSSSAAVLIKRQRSNPKMPLLLVVRVN
jgi:hypothetical protein